MYLNFSEPSINHLRDRNWAAEKALIFENYGPDDWVYLIIEGIPLSERAKNKTFVPIVHPVNDTQHRAFSKDLYLSRNTRCISTVTTSSY